MLFPPKKPPAWHWKRKKEVWLGTLPRDACWNVCHVKVEVINVADDALWCPWNLMVSQLTRFPAIGFMSDVPSFFCRRRECDSFYPPWWCGVLLEIRTVKVLRDTVIINCDGLHHSSPFIICAAPSSPILLFFGWTLGGAAKAKTLAPSNPSVC